MMTKNNQNNNRKNYNNRGEHNNNRVARQPKVNPNEFKAPLFLPASLDENVVREIIEVLSTTKFNKISIPLGTYRYNTDTTVDVNDTRVCTIGYIRNYNQETEEFTVSVFSKFTDLVKSFNDAAIELQFTMYKEKLGTITKFNIIPVIYTEEEVNESNE